MSNAIFDYIMPIFHNPSNPITLIALSLIIFISFNKKIRESLLKKSLPVDKVGGITIILSIFLSILATDQVGKSIKNLKLRERPWVEQTHKDMNCLVCKIDSTGKYHSGGRNKSMPSNHSANSIALAFIISFFFPKIKRITYMFAATIMFSRVYIGVHYPIDVIIGAIIGLLCSILVSKGILFYISNKKLLN